MKRWFYVLPFVLILSQNCSKDSSTSPGTATKEIWPLKTGNNWALIKNGDIQNVSERIRIVDKQIRGNASVFTAVWENIPESATDTMLLATNNRGVFFHTPEGNKHLVFKYPVNVGEKWHNPFEGGTIECISTKESLQTPTGRFNCVIYRFADEGDIQNGTFYLQVYLCPGIGYIAEQRRRDEAVFDWFKLKSYQVNK